MLKNLLNNKGNVAIIVAGSMIVLLGFTALAVDIGLMVNRKAELQKACDAAALAGAQEIVKATGMEIEEATDYAKLNGTTDNTILEIYPEDKKITVKASENVEYFFAKALSVPPSTVSVQATAVVAPITKIGSGLRPFGIVDDAFSLGQTIILKGGSKDVQNGNFGALRLDGGEGASDYYNMIVNGSNNIYEINDPIPTEPGNVVQKTQAGIEKLLENGTTIITVPIIDRLDVSGTSENVTIIGFARVQLWSEEVDDNDKEDKKDKDNNGNGEGHTQIKAKFLERLLVGGSDPDQENYGAVGVKLID